MLQPFSHAYRSARIAGVAATVFASYKLNGYTRWLLGNGHNGQQPSIARAAMHRRNAQRIFDVAVELRGLLIKMCQVIGTRSDIFDAHLRSHEEAMSPGSTRPQ